jgi:hypothetical protein
VRLNGFGVDDRSDDNDDDSPAARHLHLHHT